MFRTRFEPRRRDLRAVDRRVRRVGQTLLELVCATGIIAAAVLPALRMMRDSLHWSAELESADQMATLAASKLEEHLALESAQWLASEVNGDFSAEGFTKLRYRVTRSDQPGDGGIVGRLMAISVLVWDDADSSGTLNGGERKIALATKLASVASYQDEAQGN